MDVRSLAEQSRRLAAEQSARLAEQSARLAGQSAKIAGQSARMGFTVFDEFRSFALKGNVVDLAVATMIGAAFGKIVDSLVKDVFMPFINVFVPEKMSYTEWALPLLGKEIPVGRFLGEFVNFVIVAGVLFIFTVKFLGFLLRVRKSEAAAPPPPPTRDQLLLTEIRELMSQQLIISQQLTLAIAAQNQPAAPLEVHSAHDMIPPHFQQQPEGATQRFGW